MKETWLEKVAFEISFAYRLYVRIPLYHFRTFFRYAWQRLTRGFDDRVTWSVRDYFIGHAIAVMERYMSKDDGVPYRYVEKAGDDMAKATELWHAEIRSVIQRFKDAQLEDDTVVDMRSRVDRDNQLTHALLGFARIADDMWI